MELKSLLEFDDILIQTHDNPDADAIASGFGLYRFFSEHGKKVKLIYGGKNKIEKSNLLKMIDLFDIPIEYMSRQESTSELLITADCQYGERNVKRFEGKTVAVIDHHMVKDENALPERNIVRSNYGSCATIVWDLLLKEGYDVSADEKLSSALYYGLYMDTNKMQELRHPKDKDMRDALEFGISAADLFLLENSNLSAKELRIAGEALLRFKHNKKEKYAVVRAKECDPNILGIISDALIEVDNVDSCVVYCRMVDGIKLSVRSCVKAIRADELAAYVCDGIGSGGGHMRKAGGFISIENLEATGYSEKEFIEGRLADYFKDQTIIYSGKENSIDLSDCPLYKKLPLPIGYVRATDMYKAGTRVTVRMLEGDMPVVIKENTFFIIGVESEVYMNDEEYFYAHNDLLDDPYVFSGEYEPTLCKAVGVDDGSDYETKRITDYVKSCRPKAAYSVRAKELDRRVKVIVPWSDNYMTGNPGDFIVARAENPGDVYIVKKDIMEKSYKLSGE